MLNQILDNAVSAAQNSKIRYIEMLADVKEFVDGCKLGFEKQTLTPTRTTLRMIADQRDLMLARANAVLTTACDKNLATMPEIEAVITRRRTERKRLHERRLARRAQDVAFAERIRAGQV